MRAFLCTPRLSPPRLFGPVPQPSRQRPFSVRFIGFASHSGSRSEGLRPSVRVAGKAQNRRSQANIGGQLLRLPCHPAGRWETGDGRQETGDRRWLTADGKNNPRQLPPRVLRTNHPTDRTAAREIDQKSEAASTQGGSLATQIPPSDGSGITPRERPRRGPC